MNDWFTAVSYTHLDVYKRQVVESLLQAAPALAGGVTVATWAIWGIGSALLVLLGAGLHLFIALWRRRGGGSGPNAGRALAAG